MLTTSTLTANTQKKKKKTYSHALTGKKTSSIDIDNYKVLTDFNLRHLNISGILSPCTDYSCQAHSDVIMNTLEKII